MTERKLYITKEETQKLTDAVIQYNKDNNPIKIYNGCFDYYVETYNDKPIYCDNWLNVLNIRKDFEYHRIEKSINRSMSNEKSKVVRDFDYIRSERRKEIDECMERVEKINPVKGKQKPIEMPMIIWSNIEMIARNYVQNYRFFEYTYKEDLIMGSIEKCLRYISNFSPVSSDNAFSYFTTIIRHSFIENIKREYNYSNIKQKLNTKFYGASNEEQNVMQEDGDYNDFA